MKSKAASSMTVLQGNERLALLKLAQRVLEIPVMAERWSQDCIVSFGWSDEDTKLIMKNVRKLARRELRRETKQLEL